MLKVTFSSVDEEFGPSGSVGMPAELSSMAIRRLVDIGASLAVMVQIANFSGATVVPIPALGLAAIVLAGATLVPMAGSILGVAPTTLARMELGVLGLAALTVALQVVAVVHFSPSLQSDEAVLSQAAGTLVLHGHDPYGAHLVAATRAFRESPSLETPLQSGGWVRLVEYPGLALLVTALSVWLTHGFESIVIADAVALILTMFVMFALMPHTVRALSVVVVLAIPGLVTWAFLGVVAVLALPLLAFAVSQWDSGGALGAEGRFGWVQAAALGLACAVSQLAWLVAPFLLLAIWRTNQARVGWARGTRHALRFALVATVSFTVVNIPFVVANPQEWLGSVAAPLLQAAIPNGLGLATLPLLAHAGGGYLDGYTLGAALAYVALMIAAWLWLDRLRGVVLVLPILAVTVSPRSLREYWALLLPVWVTAAATLQSPMTSVSRDAMRASLLERVYLKAALVVVGAAAVAEVLLALSAPPPIAVIVTEVFTSRQSQLSSQILVRLTNLTDTRLSPHFVIATGGGRMVWTRRTGPRALGAYASAEYRLVAPEPRARLPQTPFQVDVLTASPETLSVSPLHVPG